MAPGVALPSAPCWESLQLLAASPAFPGVDWQETPALRREKEGNKPNFSSVCWIPFLGVQSNDLLRKAHEWNIGVLDLNAKRCLIVLNNFNYRRFKAVRSRGREEKFTCLSSPSVLPKQKEPCTINQNLNPTSHLFPFFCV